MNNCAAFAKAPNEKSRSSSICVVVEGPDHHCGDDIAIVTVMVLASTGVAWPGGRAVMWTRFMGMTIQKRKVLVRNQGLNTDQRSRMTTAEVSSCFA